MSTKIAQLKDNLAATVMSAKQARKQALKLETQLFQTRTVLKDNQTANKLLAKQARKRALMLETQLSQARAVLKDNQAASTLLAKQAKKQALMLEAQLSQAKAALKSASKGRQGAQEKIVRMERSLSWRITRPIRFLRSMLGRMR